MQAGNILTNIAIILVAAALWDDLRRGGRIAPAPRTYLLVACIFALISAILQVFPLLP